MHDLYNVLVIQKYNAQLMCVLSAFFCLLTVSCQSQGSTLSGTTPNYSYDPDKTAYIKNGKAVAPKDAPIRVKRAIAAANEIATKPYRRGGGHGRHEDSAYDCSGATAYVLKEAGMLRMNKYPVSGGFLKWGRPGFGDWITVYAKNGHVFLMIAGLRFDTSGSRRGIGPRWYTKSRQVRGFKVRHVPGV